MQYQTTIKNPGAFQLAVDDLSNILDAVGAISTLVQDDLVRRACEGDQPFLNDTLHGGLMSALQQLSQRGAETLDRIEYRDSSSTETTAPGQGESVRRTLAEWADDAAPTAKEA